MSVASEDGIVAVPENALTYALIQRASAIFPGTGNVMPWTEKCCPNVFDSSFILVDDGGRVLEGGVLKSMCGTYRESLCWDLAAKLMPGTYTMKATVTVYNNGGGNTITLGLRKDAREGDGHVSCV